MKSNSYNDIERYRVISHFKVEKLVITCFVISVMVSVCISAFFALSEERDLVLSFIFYLLYTFPTVFLLGGTSSFLIEHKLRIPLIVKQNRILKYIYKLFLYMLAGSIGINIFWTVITLQIPSFTTLKEFFLLNDLGIIGGLIYYHFLLLFQVIGGVIEKKSGMENN
ncbi:hypothetical protein [Paenibacillus radicis (ex Gao et al. 2016)]|uniref:Uncharacterized protein n=1 Tax=Paenibacillus radicis (ex Gao et al. 2016) TaxID=1737354 RepID=A0A917HI51_9BACL|nr:hypothetical protein [Paenibacillus radicis (ex Gao et al. 2016)]GGG78840.1 hypothetical protein GCM10010918_39760 [Paenibacillus radicis (ex Gao et al. 2016)]